MGYYVSNMIGIRTGGVFGGETDMDDMKERIKKIVLSMRGTENNPALGDKQGDISHCMSKELVAGKGSYVVISGVFNYWVFSKVSIFAKALSKEFQTEVMLMSWDEEQNIVKAQIYLDGESLFEQSENESDICDDIHTILRRVF